MTFAALAVVLAGCATKTEWTHNVQPERTLDEMYALQESVADAAHPFPLGCGDMVGVYTHHQARLISAALGGP
jgi:hypothetical protein